MISIQVGCLVCIAERHRRALSQVMARSTYHIFVAGAIPLHLGAEVDGHSPALCSVPFSRVCASAVTSAEILVRTLSSPGPDVVFISSAARRKASRRNNRAVIASN